MEQIYVVSDIHLGGKGSHCREFSDFLRWIRDLRDADSYECTECEDPQIISPVILHQSTKLILLGDVLELWDPKDQNRNSVLQDAIEPLSCIHEIPGEIIYVTGNHDEDIRDLAIRVGGSFPWHPEKDIDPDGPQRNNFIVVHNHYPESGLKEVTTSEGLKKTEKVMPGVPVDGIRCAFLHGHQFDQEQIQYLIGKVFGARFDPVDLISDLANVTLVQQLKEWSTIIVIAWLCSILMVSGLLDPFLIAAGSVIFALVPFFLLARRHSDAKRITIENNVRGWRRYLIRWIFFWSLPTVIILFIVTWYADLFIPLATRALPIVELIILTYLFIMVPFVQTAAAIKLEAYKRFVTVKDKRIDKALDAGFNPVRETFDCDVVVFGHTHMAGWTILSASRRNPGMSEKKPLLCMNTGCWVTDGSGPERNTFISINARGVSLMQWLGQGKVRILRHFSREEMRTLQIIED